MKKIIIICILTLGVWGCKEEAPEPVPQPRCNCGILIRRILINNDFLFRDKYGNPVGIVKNPPTLQVDIKSDCGDTVNITVKSHYGLKLKQYRCF